ncbi:MAG TPA: vitamin K epoxide reductase family protein [Steroidobacteraceae bacterium]|nr:vitamin K epoxide reductase family protein [Steroidobacteraceae bacterium]
MQSRKRLPCLVLFLLSVTGVGISIYLTAVHYAGAPLVCTASGLVNCERVLTSGYSSVLGVPVSVGGIAWFGVTGALALVGVLRRPEPALLQPAQIAWSLLGLASVLYLVGVEVVALGVICAWCTAAHVLIVATLLVSVLRTPSDAAQGSATANRTADSPRRPASRPRAGP